MSRKRGTIAACWPMAIVSAFLFLAPLHVGLAQSLTFSAQISERLSLAGVGDAKAQFRLGIAYFAGHSVARDLVEAQNWFRKAVEQGNVKAMNNLAFSPTSRRYFPEPAHPSGIMVS